jgi:hypothetical protein
MNKFWLKGLIVQSLNGIIRILKVIWICILGDTYSNNLSPRHYQAVYRVHEGLWRGLSFGDATMYVLLHPICTCSIAGDGE